jgi:hypothetical protein
MKDTFIIDRDYGGIILEYVQRRGFEFVVRDVCMSACTVVLGDGRSFANGASVGAA